MQISNSLKGSLLALGAAIALANSFIFSKAVLNEISFVQFGFVWFSFGLVWNVVYYIFQKRKNEEINSNVILYSSIVALLEAIATVLFYVAIHRMENPAIVSFIGNMGPVFVTILGIVFLSEKYNWKGAFGIALTIFGVFIINFRTGYSISNFLIPGAEFVIAASFIFSIATIVARKQRNNINSSLLSLIRVSVLFLGFSMWFIISDAVLPMSFNITINVIIGSFLETFMIIVFAVPSTLVKSNLTIFVVEL